MRLLAHSLAPASAQVNPHRAPAGTIAAVIVSYDEDASQTRAAVDSLLAQTRPPREILVMNNGTPGRLRETLRGYAAEVKAIECGANLGYIALNNAAARAISDYLLCLNPDAAAHEDCLEQLAAVADSDARVARLAVSEQHLCAHHRDAGVRIGREPAASHGHLPLGRLRRAPRGWRGARCDGRLGSVLSGAP